MVQNREVCTKSRKHSPPSESIGVYYTIMPTANTACTARKKPRSLASPYIYMMVANLRDTKQQLGLTVSHVVQWQ